MKLLNNILFTIGIIILISFHARATHVSGGQITYECIGSNQYQITMNLYYDCSATISMPQNVTIQVANTCGYGNTSISLPLQNPGGTDVSQVCPSLSSNCSGGSVPGTQEYTYTGVLTLNPPCDSYTLSYSLCCRNSTANVTNSTSDNFFVQTVMNTATNNCNNSPTFSNTYPNPYICVGQPADNNFGVIESDGDSLVYELVSAQSNATNLVNYAPGYSGAAPFAGITINPQTGQLSFTPTNVGFFIVVVKISEYDSNGNLLGYVIRDVQFIVTNCSNNNPSQGNGVITNLTGQADSLGLYSIGLCESTSFSFDISFNDPDALDILTYTSNIGSVLPGATITSSGFNPITLTISWTAPPGSAGTNTFFDVTVSDNACPIPGVQSIIYYVNVFGRTNTIPDTDICLGDNIELTTVGGSNFTWTVLNGDSIDIGNNFSCDTCQSPIVSPQNNTTYIVDSDLIGCISADTVTISVIDPNATILTPSQSVCKSDSAIQLLASNPIGIWLGPGITSQINGIFSPNSAGVGTHTIRHRISASGCFDEQSIQITVSEANVSITPINPIVCDNANTIISATGAATYNWDSSPYLNTTIGGTVIATPDTTTTFRVVGTDAIGCKDVATTTLFVYPKLEVNVSSDQTICAGKNSMPITAVGIGGDSSYSYSWTPTNFLNSSVGDTIIAKPDSTTNFVVTVRDGCQNEAKDTITIFVDQLSDIEFTTDTTAGCIPFDINFNVTTLGLVNYEWNFGDGYGDTTNFDTTSHNYTDIGNFDVILTATDTNGCKNTSAPTTILSNRLPVADFYVTPNPTTIFNSYIAFTDQSSMDVSNWYWEIDSLHTDTLQNFSYFFNDTGTFNIQLIVRTENMCYDTTEQELVILNDFVLYMPNAFSPDQNDLNETFAPKGLNLETYKFNMQVFNRWGNLVFETNDPIKGWDGTVGKTGEMAKKGTYAWVILIGENEASLKYTGHVTIIK